jgi:phage baseplate assembly protein W
MVVGTLGYPKQAITGSSASNVVYLDVNINYLIDQKQITVVNADAIQVKIINVLFTDIGSRPFEPTFGSRFPQLLFSNIKPNGQQAYIIKTEIYTALKKWLGGIINLTIGGINVAAYPNQGAYYLSINYAVIGSTTPQNLSLRYTQ